jgi:malate synthase
MTTAFLPSGVEIKATPAVTAPQLLTPAALEFIAKLAREFQPRREGLLRRREERQHEIDGGSFPDFLPSTQAIRDDHTWKVAAIPNDLQDRRTEITGPVDRKMIINALNSGAKVFMADFEDATSPTWKNLLEGQANLCDAVRRTISFAGPDKKYQLHDEIATLVVRPRGWHLPERHLVVDGQPVAGSLFDFGLYFFHNARELLARGSGPYFYLPKLESHLEARLWNDVFNFAQDELQIPRGTIRATVLIETILASFEAEEILYELREHAAGLNCGRWDYIFSFIKKFRAHRQFVLPDRAQVTMTAPMMRAYSLNVIKICHRRGAHAIGGMAAQIPIKGDPEANDAALEKVLADKEREVTDGHDGTWVAHPGLVPVALRAFNRHMPSANQIYFQRDDVAVTAGDLLQVPTGTITTEGVRSNIRIGVQYLEAWLSGNGCVPLYNLMEDAATVEIARAQIWQWLHYAPIIEDGPLRGREITSALYHEILGRELHRIENEVGPIRFGHGRYEAAAKLFTDMSRRRDFVEFLTLAAYPQID